MNNPEKHTENYDPVRVNNPATDAKGHGAGNSFIFLRNISGKTIAQTRTTQKSLRRKFNAPINPESECNSRVKFGGYIRRKEAAKYLGISLRTLTDWQQRRIIPFVDVSHRVTLFKLDDLDQAMNRFIVKAIGDKP